MKIVKERYNDTCIDEMKSGEIGVITQWDANHAGNGLIVSRSYIHLFGVGTDHTWTGFFGTSHPKVRVRILGPGTQLEIT